MDAGNALDENRRLRRTIRDLVALSTLPAVWSGLGSHGIARSLADVLLNTLSLDLVYVRLTDLAGEGPVEVVRSKHSTAVPVGDVREALAPLLRTFQPEPPATISDPFGAGTLHVAVTRFGIDGDHGVLVAGSCNADFPTEQDRLLLGVAANQTALVAQGRRAEERVQEQGELLRVTLASIGDAVIATDTEGCITFLNPVAEELTGWKQADAKGQPLETVFVIVNEQTREPVEDPAEKVLREGAIVGLGKHTILIAKDGTERPIDDSAAPIRDTEGALIGVVLTFRDVTEQRRTERAVRQSEARKSAVLETALDCIITMDHEGRVVEFNPAAEKTFGYSRGQVVGHELSRFIIPPHLRERHRQGLAHYLAAGEGPVLGKRLELPALRADGSEFPVELAITRISTDGPPLFTAYLRDITERKRAEEALRNSEQRFARFMQHLPGLAWIKDVRGRYIYANDAAVTAFRVPRAELYGKTDDEVFPPETAAQFRENDRQAISRGTGVQVVEILGQEDGDVRYSLASKFPILGPDGQVALVGGMAMDITDRRRVEEALRHSEERFRSLMEQAPFSIQVFSPDGRTIRVNRTWEELWGVRFEQIEGYNILEDRQLEARGVLWHIHQGFAGQPTRIPAIQYNPKETIPGITEGEDLRRWLSAVIYPLKDADGKVREVVLIHEDITARKRAEEELQRSEKQSRTILESITDAFCAFDRDWRFTYVNRQAEVLLGRGRNDLLGKSHWEEYADTLGTELERTYRRAVADNVTATLEHFYAPHDRWYEVHAYPSPEGLSVYFRDVSQRRRAEAALRESEEKLRLLADTIPQLAWMARPDGYIFWYNRRWYEYTGTKLEQMEGWGWQAVHDPVELPNVLERWQASIASGEPFDMVFPLKGADEQFRPFLTRVNPLRDDCGRILYWFGTNTDISDIKGMEEALRQSEQRFRQLADAMPQIVWTARPDGNIDYLNRRWTEFTGLPETVGNDAWGPLMHPDDAPSAYERWAASLQSGAMFETELRLLDRSKQGYRWHLIRTVAVPDGDGKVARWFGTSTDIHEQKRAEESSRFLAEASAELAGVVDYESTLQKVANLAVPYFADWSAVDLADDDGNLRRLAVAHQDPEKVALVEELMREYPPDPQSPVGAFAVLRTGKPEIVTEITDDMLVQQATEERHLRLIRSFGLNSYICVPLVVSGKTLGLLTFLTAESGRKYTEADLALAMDLAHRAAVAIDNTQLYQALRETDRRKDEFLAMLAHELRNPLAPVRSALQILKMPRVDAETAERSREMMERQVQHLVRLVDDLMDVSRVMRGKIELRREKVELATIVARAIETVQPLVDAHDHDLSVRMSSESLLLDADPLRLAQVLTNLLANAAKYTDPGGRIWLTAERDGDMAALRVRDNGIGIAPHMLPRVFELFVQVDHASTKAQGGLGIGLTLVKNLVEMHNGIVQAFSEGIGQGCEFVVKLPVIAQALDQVQAPEMGRQTDQLPPPSGKRLMVVDDNQDAANSLAMLLRLQGHEVRVAFSGVAAVEMTKTYTPDVVFMDIGMPGMDGYEAARRIREQPGLGRLVLAALTGWGQQEDRRRTAQAGFDHHLVKPPEPRALESVLDSVKSAKGTTKKSTM